MMEPPTWNVAELRRRIDRGLRAERFCEAGYARLVYFRIATAIDLPLWATTGKDERAWLRGINRRRLRRARRKRVMRRGWA